MAEYSSGSITFTGLGNGTDFQKVIEGLMMIERMNVEKLESWKEDWQEKIDALQDLNTKLLSLETTLEGMDTMDKFMVKSVSSTDGDALTAVADSEAYEGTHSVEINQLAENDIWTHSGLSSMDSTLSGGTFSFQYASNAQVDISVASGTTLSQFRDMVNNDPTAKEQVRASIIFDGTSYHLQIAGRDLGDDNDLTLVDTSPFSGSFSETQDAQNSQFKLDGFPSGAGSWIERSTNTVSDAVEGLTLYLKDITSPSSVRLSVNTDTDSIKENVRTFVDQVNEVRSMIKDITDVTQVSDDQVRGSVLTGNYGVQQLVSQRLKDIIASSGLGFILPDPSDPSKYHDEYTALSQVGILTNANEGAANEGLLELDEDMLDEALTNDPDAVAMLFSADHVGGSDTSSFSYYSYIDGITEAGKYSVSYTVSGGSITAATINGHEASIDNTNGTITGKSGEDESGLVLKVNPSGDGTFTGNAYLRLGKVNEMINALEQMTDSEDGPIHIIEENYEDIIENINKKIAREDDRLVLKERNLKLKYARLDELLQNYENQNAQLGYQLNQLE